MKDNHFTSKLCTLSGALLTVSGVLMIISGILTPDNGNLLIGGAFLAAASCMFLSAYHHRLAENKRKTDAENNQEKTEESQDE